MPSKSWSLPAHITCPGKVTGPNTICGMCYAQKGSYTWSTTKRAQMRRYLWTIQSLKTAEGRESWITTMADVIGRTRNSYFRVHDSGDLFSEGYLDLWIAVCTRLPQIRFWFPTRSYHNVPWAHRLVELAALPNVRIRASALYFGDPAPVIDGLGAGSTAAEEGFNCPASKQGNKCRECRACWDSAEAISYHKH